MAKLIDFGAGKLGDAVPSGSYPESSNVHVHMYFYNKKEPMPDSRLAPFENFKWQKEDLSAEARSGGCGSPHSDAVHALLIGR